MAKLAIGAINFFDEFNSNLEWKHIPIQPERRYPFRFRLNVGTRRFDITFKLNPLDITREGLPFDDSGKLFIKIIDVDNNNTVIYNDAVIEKQMFKVVDLYIFINTLVIKNDNMLSEGDFGGELQMGAAIE